MADDIDVLPSTDVTKKTIAGYDDGDGKIKQLMRMVFGVKTDPQVVSKSNGLPTVMGALNYKPFLAGTTTVLTGAGSGAAGDRLDFIWAVPTTTTPGTLSIKDGTATAVEVHHGGTLNSLQPFSIPVGALSVVGAWQVVAGAGWTGIGYGKLT